MRLDGFGLLVEDMGKMIRFYRDVLGFEIKEAEDASNVYLVKDGTLFLLYGRKDFEKMTNRRYDYIKGKCGRERSDIDPGTGDGAVGTEDLLYCGSGRESYRNRFLEQVF